MIQTSGGDPKEWQSPTRGWSKLSVVVTTASLFASSAADVSLDRVRQLLAQDLPESLTLEYKEAFTSNITRTVAAMANTYGGIILVGVADQASADRIVGVTAATVTQIINACHDAIEPPWEPEVIPVPVGAAPVDRYVLVVRIDAQRAPRPLLVNGAAPVRLHGRNATADRGRLVALFAERLAQDDRIRRVLPQPQLPTKRDGSPDADFVIRSGFWLPVSESAAWRPLPERAVEQLAEALNASSLGQALRDWASQFGARGSNPFHRRGLNRARRARLVWQAVIQGPVTCPLECIAELVLPGAYGPSARAMSLTVDFLTRGQQLMVGADWPGGTPRWRFTPLQLHGILLALVGALVDVAVVTALADIAGVDPVLIPQPSSVAFITGPPVDALLAHEQLSPIVDAGTSYGAQLVSDPTLDLSDAVERVEQVDSWLQQIALDAGLLGMERILAERRAQ